MGNIDMSAAGADRSRFDARSLVRPLRHAASAGTNLVLGGSTMSYVTGRDGLAGATVDRSNPFAILGVASSLAASAWFARGLLHADAGVRALGAAITRGTAGAATLQSVEAAGLLRRFDDGIGLGDRMRLLPGLDQFGDGRRLTQLGRGYDQGLRLAASAATTRVDPPVSAGVAARSDGGVLALPDGVPQVVWDRDARRAALASLRRGDGIEAVLRERDPAANHLVAADDVRAIVDDHAMRQSVGWTGAGNPLRRNADIRTAADGVHQLDWGVDLGSRGGLAHGLGALGIGDASVAAWGARVGIAPGASRANARLLDSSSRAVRVAQRAGAAGAADGSQSTRERLVGAARDWPATSRFALPVAGSLVTSGAAGHMYAESRRR